MYGNFSQYPQQYGQYGQYGQQIKSNILPPQQVIQVNGQASAQSIQMSPNSSVIVADSTLPMVYMCISDGLGNVTVTPYDISPHQEKPTIDINGFEARLQKIENFLAAMEEKANVKSNVKSNKSKSNDTELSPD